MTPLFLEDRVKSGDLGRVLSISAEEAGGYLHWQRRQGVTYIGRGGRELPILAEKAAGYLYWQGRQRVLRHIFW